METSRDKHTDADLAKTLLLGSNAPEAARNPETLAAASKQHAQQHGLHAYESLLKRGALLANFGPEAAEVTQEEAKILDEEKTHRFKQAKTMTFLAALVALCAAVQGMDESVISGGGLFYPTDLRLADYKSIPLATLEGLISSAPYLGAGAIGCWVAVPMNEWFGRRVTIFCWEIVNIGSVIWQGLSPSWQSLMAARLIMGLAIGAKSATAPVYTSESAPAILRGGLVMLWQTFTAFGVMIGTIMGIAFYQAAGNWRYMLGSPVVPPTIVASCIFFLPESPRWLISKGKHEKALKALMRLRRCDLAAARDYFYIIEGLHQTKTLSLLPGLKAMLTIKRNRFAMVAAFTVMVLQQLCGINILTFYIGQILVSGGFSEKAALAGSVGFGALAWLGNVATIPLIDRVGRRTLLLWTFPMMAITLLAAGLSFFIADEKARIAPVLLFIYLYTLSYAFGEGPVPFTYSAEVFPLEIRSLGMAFGTSTTWIFCWALGMSLPSCLVSLGNTGTFGLYTGLCVLGWFMIFFLVPESKQYTLEELDTVFNIGVSSHVRFTVLKMMQHVGLARRGEAKLSLLEWAMEQQGMLSPSDGRTSPSSLEKNGALSRQNETQHVEQAIKTLPS